MPWTAEDADRHKKGLTSAQAKRWATIANRVLARCQAENGSDCEGRAIRIANDRCQGAQEAEGRLRMASAAGSSRRRSR